MPIDKKAYAAKYKKHNGVFDKKNRYNNLLGDEDLAADYANKKGSVADCSKYPVTSKLRAVLTTLLCAASLYGETNHYYDVSGTGIGWHGDRERKIVEGVRLGPGANGMPLKFMWFRDSTPVGDEGRITILNAGDVYFMSEKAVGTDWLTKKNLTLRHAAGADVYSTVQKLTAIKDGRAPVPAVMELCG
mmetsp:Transcript_14476/g.38488  ORF Transcript_14476/g.38488 Transcript_14476/m.38488 type:complete len:189 (+) Transcript_14476:2-568(+)